MNIYLYSKRILSVIFLILGAVLIFFVPENTWIGVALLFLGIGIEIAGLVLRHNKQKNQK
jgi:Na+/phosphate symporter